MRKQNVLQRKRSHLYSIQIPSTPKTSSCSMWNILKRKSKARKHEVGRGKHNFHWWQASQFKVRYHSLKWAWSCLSSPWMVMDEEVPKGWPLPPGISGGHPEASLVGAPEEADMLRASHWCSAHTGLFSPSTPAPWTLPVNRLVCWLLLFQMSSL